MLEIYNGRDKFYQWDVNQKLIVDDNIIAVQYDNGTGDALVCGVYEIDGVKVADVPNIMLQSCWAIKCYAYCGECVRAEKVYEVEKRSRPDDYIYTETETLRYSTLFDMLTDLEAKHNEEVAAINTTVNKNNDDIANLNIEYEMRYNNLINDINNGFANVYDEDSKIRQELKYQDTKINGQLEQINKHTEEISNHEAAIKQVEALANNNNTRLDGQEETISVITKYVNQQFSNTNDKITNHENRITTLENRPSGGGTGTASEVDWNENNPDSPAYIKNRTHYEEMGFNVLMPETNLTLEDADGFTMVTLKNPIGLEVGKTYNIHWNGTTYQAPVINGKEIFGVDVMLAGNMDLLLGTGNTEQPFIIEEFTTSMDGYYAVIMALDGITNLNISIDIEDIIIHKIDDKFINIRKPDWMAQYGETGYIANRTHYLEHWGEYNLDLTQTEGLVSFEYKPGIIAYKVSDDQLPAEAIRQAYICYRKGDMQYATLHAIPYQDDGYTLGDLPNWGGIIVIGVLDWANETLGINATETGTYFYITGNYDYMYANALNIYYKLDNNYLDLEDYYRKAQVDTLINNATKEDEYELIETITAEEVNSFYVENLNLKEILIQIYTPATDASTNCGVYVYQGSINRYVGISQLLNTAERYTKITAKAEKGITTILAAQPASKEENTSGVAGFGAYIGADNITRLRFMLSNQKTFPLGTIITIWGVRA